MSRYAGILLSVLAAFMLVGCTESDVINELQEQVAGLETRIGALEEAAGIPDSDETQSLGERVEALENAGFLTEEVDPVFEASPAGLIQSTDLTDWDNSVSWGDHAQAGYLTSESDPVATAAGYLTSESDPAYSTSAAAGISTATIANWDNSVSWGDHAQAGYLTSESDPLFASSAAAGVSTSGIADWDEAHSWGDHAAASYIQLLDSDTTWTAATSAELLDLLDDLDSYGIGAAATLTIELAAGVYSFSAPLSIHHRDGGRVEIVGDGVATTTLSFPASDGIVVDEGTALGYLSDVTVIGGTGDHDGITVEDGSSLWLGLVNVEGFGGQGIYARRNSTLHADEGILVSDCGENGIQVREGSYANVSNATSQGNGSRGVLVVGAFGDANGVSSLDNGAQGFQASGGGALSVRDSTAAGNGSNGVVSLQNSGVDATNSTVQNNSSYGYYADEQGYIDADNSCAQDNGYAGYATWANALVIANSVNCDLTTSTQGHETDWIYGP